MNNNHTSNLPGIGRRRFLGSFAALAVSQISGCYWMPFVKSHDECPQPRGDQFIVDMHCHLLNVQDIEPQAFIERRITNTDEGFLLWDMLSGLLTAVLLKPIKGFIKTATDETIWTRQTMAKLQSSPQEFCNAAIDEQGGLFFANPANQLVGQASNRTRNAARMMALFPEVDLFTPAMVDLGEGSFNGYSDPYELASYYEHLHIASNGRFVPLVSYSPDRAWEEGQYGLPRRQLIHVRDCVEKRGFIGVKVHPSSGFSPVNNQVYGCPNTPRQQSETLSAEKAHFLNEQLDDLYALCRSLDIPILTHSGIGITSNQECMQKKFSAPSTWTNSPVQWGMAIEKANERSRDELGAPIAPGRKLRVCLAHFAGGFTASGDVHPWLNLAAEEMEKNSSMYIDLSSSAEMFTNDRRGVQDTHREVFLKFLARNRKLADKMMYGTDWNMPQIAQIGNHYLPVIRSLVPEQLRSQTMGLNAAEFYGLRPGENNRERLKLFYQARGVSLEKVSWMTKLDRINQVSTS